MAKSEQPQTGGRDRGTLWHTNAFAKVPSLCLRPEFVHPGCTNIGIERGLNDDEDRQHFVGSVLVRRRPEFVQHGCTNCMGLLCGLSASDKGNEDRQHFVCAT
jgi:hypothetical protein